ncbi:MAG: hypothetical protein ACK5Z0_01390 [Planctomycetota bacterium]
MSQNRDEVFILPHGEELKHQVKYGNRFADEQTTDGMIFNENRLRQGNVQIRSHSAHQSKKKAAHLQPENGNLTWVCCSRTKLFFEKN